MFEIRGSRDAGLRAADMAAFITGLAGMSTEVGDAERVDVIGRLESVKAAAGAAQARFTAEFDASQRAEQRAAGVPPARVGQGIAAQVGLARRESPARAAKFVGWSQILVGELPATFAALERGEISKWRAMIVARETIWLTREGRAVVDAALAGRLSGLGDRQIEVEARRLAYRLDPDGFLARARAAERDRRVSLRPAPDTMSRLSALLPAANGVAVHAALAHAADTLRAAGDERGRGQVMADTLVERVTGQAAAAAVPVEINLVMTDHTLFNQTTHPASDQHHHRHRTPDSGSADGDDARGGTRSDDDGCGDGGCGGDEPAHLVGYGPIPAGLARDLAFATDAAKVWVRRLYTDPVTGHLAATDTRRRRFNEQVRRAIIIRDQICRTPWCGAPIRHTDHARPAANAGPTNFNNGQGLCEACNYAKDAYGWTTEPGPGGTSTSATITTPTGHTYTSRPPDLPGTPPPTTSRQRAGPGPPATESHAA